MNMWLPLQEGALLVKLCYLKCSTSTAFREFRTRQKICQEPLSLIDLKEKIKKFEKAGSLTICPGRGRKLVPKEVITNVDGSLETIAGSNSTQGVAR